MQNGKLNALEKAKREIGYIIQSLNSTTVCFTGHRSQKLPWRFNEEDERCKVMKEKLRFEIEKAIQRGYRTFLCGMALGFDMICAETVLDLKEVSDCAGSSDNEGRRPSNPGKGSIDPLQSHATFD